MIEAYDYEDDFPRSYTPEILAGEEECSECRGMGRVVTKHSYPRNSYGACHACSGSGKTKLRAKCEAEGCEEKEAIDPLDEMMRSIDPGRPIPRLCREHHGEIRHLKFEMEEMKEKYSRALEIVQKYELMSKRAAQILGIKNI